MSKLKYINADGETIHLDGRGNVRLRRLLGAGAPGVLNQTVQTPSRDGATYIGRTVLQPRFLIAELLVTGICDWSEELAFRRLMLNKINPKRGMGELRYTPDGLTEYAISAIYEGGLGFDEAAVPDGYLRMIPLNLQCPQPSWRDVSQNAIAIVIADAGLVVPITVPIAIGAREQTVTFAYVGDVESYPSFSVPGPFDGPYFYNDTGGQHFGLPGLHVETGETLTVNMAARTAILNDGTSVMSYRTDDSFMWALQLGMNTVRISLEAGHPMATISYDNLYLGV